MLPFQVAKNLGIEINVISASLPCSCNLCSVTPNIRDWELCPWHQLTHLRKGVFLSLEELIFSSSVSFRNYLWFPSSFFSCPLLQVPPNLLIFQLYFCYLILCILLTPLCLWLPDTCFWPKVWAQGLVPYLLLEGDFGSQCPHDHSRGASHGHLQGMENCISWCRNSRCGLGVSFTWPAWKLLTKSAEGFHQYCW